MTARSLPSANSLSRLRGLLLERIHRRYGTITAPLQLGKTQIQFTRIADPNGVLDQVAEEEDLRERLHGPRDKTLARPQPLHLPYWAELWDSALAIAELLLSGGAGTGPCLRVLDLGCGMGLTGSAAAMTGHRVLFADLEPPALLFAALNSLENHLHVRTRQLDWRVDALHEEFDMIIGADILYERSQWEYLEPFWRKHLAPGGSILLGEPGRQSGDLFVPWIQERGWALEITSHPVATRTVPIRLLRLLKK